MKWEEYENLCKLVFEQLGKADDINVLGFGNACKIVGKSGVSHQIDVLTEHFVDGRTVKTAIECKYCDANISKDPIMKLTAIMEDCDIDYGVIIAKNGYTEDAKKFAKYKDVSLIELRKPLDKDWINRARNMTSIIRFYFPYIESIQLVTDVELDGTINVDAASILFSDDFEISLYDYINERVLERKWFNYEKTKVSIDFFSDVCLIGSGTRVAQLKGLDFEIVNHFESERRTEFRGDDLVSYYMNIIFEEREFHIEKYGALRELNRD